jgi:putative SOS response-associated peptidase YedK
MCGRFTLTLDPDQLQDIFPWAKIPPDITPRFNIAPMQPVAVISNSGDHRVEYYQWGLIPSWSKDPSIGNRMINARAETITEKPSFRNAVKRRRCLILADGFYEWKTSENEKSKTPMYIRLISKKAFAFAGLWDAWCAPDGSEIRSCAIITTQPNTLMSTIHNRMPVILPETDYLQWIQSMEMNPAEIQKYLSPYPSEQMEAYPVSHAVNNPKNDFLSLIIPASV